MSVILVLIILSLIIATMFMAFFIWAIKTGQFDDMHTPSVRMLWDDKSTQDKRLSGKKTEK